MLEARWLQATEDLIIFMFTFQEERLLLLHRFKTATALLANNGEEMTRSRTSEQVRYHLCFPAIFQQNRKCNYQQFTKKLKDQFIVVRGTN